MADKLRFPSRDFVILISDTAELEYRGRGWLDGS